MICNQDKILSFLYGQDLGPVRGWPCNAMIKTVKIAILLLFFSFGSICFAEDLTFTVVYNNEPYSEDQVKQIIKELKKGME